jgi:hypothetical protein
MSDNRLSRAESLINADSYLSRYNVYPAALGIRSHLPSAGRKGQCLTGMLLLEKALLAYPVDLVRHVLEIAQRLQSNGFKEDMVFTCKCKGPFPYGYNSSTRTMVSINVEEPISEDFDTDFVRAVNDRRLVNVQAFWGRFFDKERLEDFPELEELSHDELHKKYRVPYRRGFFDDARFAANPHLEIPKTYEELERLFPDPYVDQQPVS